MGSCRGYFEPLGSYHTLELSGVDEPEPMSVASLSGSVVAHWSAQLACAPLGPEKIGADSGVGLSKAQHSNLQPVAPLPSDH